MRNLFKFLLVLQIVTSLTAQTRVDIRNQGKKNLEPGIGVTILGSTVTSDDAVIPQYQAGSGPPVSSCLPGRDIYVDTASGLYYYCRAANTWQAVPQNNHTHAGTDISSGTILLNRGGTGQGAWISGRCVQVSADGTKLESAPVTCGGGGGSTITDYIHLAGALRNNVSNLLGGVWNLTGGIVNATLFNLGVSGSVRSVLTFAEGVDAYATAIVNLPPTWTGSAIDFRLVHTLTAVTGNVRWGLEASCSSDGESMTTISFNPVQFQVADPPATTQFRLSTTWTGVNTTGCAAGDTLFLRLHRDSDDAADTATADAYLFYGVLKVVRNAN